MTYEKTNWITGDVITAEKLNKMENGIEDASGGSGSSPLIVNMVADETDETTMSLDHTWREIYTALSEGRPVFALATTGDISDDSSSAGVYLSSISAASRSNDGSSSNYTVMISPMQRLTTSDPDGYPTGDFK